MRANCRIKKERKKQSGALESKTHGRTEIMHLSYKEASTFMSNECSHLMNFF